MTEKEKDFISKLLDINQPMSAKTNRFSNIALLLKVARKLFGCNIATGKYERLELNEERFNSGTYLPYQFSGLINYLIFLEQIGSIFIPKGGESKPNGINNALTHFSTPIIADPKINAIVSLRNSLAHRFGLATEKDPKTKPARKFTLNIERNKIIISDPATNWSGDFSDKSNSTSTTVFIVDLVELIETVYLKIKKNLEEDNLELILQGGLAELETRYTIIH